MKEDEINALVFQNKELLKEVVILREALTLTQRQLEQANSTMKQYEMDIVTLRASLLTARSTTASSDIRPRSASPPEGSTGGGFLGDGEPNVKEKRRSRSIHYTEGIAPHDTTSLGFATLREKPRSKTATSSSPETPITPRDMISETSKQHLKNPKRQSIKLFALGSFGKLRKSMSDISLDPDHCVDTTTIVGAEKSLNAANLFALLKIRPSYTNLMQRRIIFNFFDDYSMHEQSSKKVKPAQAPLVVPNLPGYRVENCTGKARSDTHWRAKVEIEKTERLENYYAIYFIGKPHSNFIGFVKNDIPVVVSVLDESETASKTAKAGEKFVRAILWSPPREYKLFLETSQHFKPNKEGKLKKRDMIKLVFPLVRLTDVKLKRLNNTDLYNDLVAFEQHTKVSNIKAGVLYVKDNQKEEDEIFGNVSTSADFEEFLEMLGDRVSLKGFSGFRGGLDVTNNSTGEKSVYTNWSGIEFMFHVTTLLPYFPLDTQHIERKRHLGNDIVNIVFKEGSTPFNPSVIRSTFTQVFLVVEKIDEGGEEDCPTHYRLSVVSKNGIPPFGPILRASFSTLDKAKFREVLLTKLCNAEMAALESPVFEEKMTRTRSTLLTSIVKKFQKPDENPKKSLKKSPSNHSIS